MYSSGSVVHKHECTPSVQTRWAAGILSLMAQRKPMVLISSLKYRPPAGMWSQEESEACCLIRILPSVKAIWHDPKDVLVTGTRTQSKQRVIPPWAPKRRSHWTFMSTVRSCATHKMKKDAVVVRQDNGRLPGHTDRVQVIPKRPFRFFHLPFSRR